MMSERQVGFIGGLVLFFPTLAGWVLLGLGYSEAVPNGYVPVTTGLFIVSVALAFRWDEWVKRFIDSVR